MELFKSVFDAYWQHARLFAVMHGILTVFVTWSIVSFARWRFDDEPLATIWQQFEIRTNFIRGLIGLFLIVGIAGTFLGLWEVASAMDLTARNSSAAAPATAVPNARAVAQTDETIRLLFRGIAKAFPVGFVGLVLTLIANLGADVVERSKRRKIEAFMDTVGDPLVDKLTKILEPVANLGHTMRDSLQPVIDRLARTLEPIPLMMGEQRRELANAAGTLVYAAEALKASGDEISSSVAGLQTMAKTARQALESATTLSTRINSYFDKIATRIDVASDRASEAFQSFDDSIAAMTTSVTEASVGLRRLPEELRGDLAKSLSESFNEASKERESALNDLYNEARQQFRANMVNAISDITSDLRRIKGEFEQVAKDVDVSVANAQNSFERYDRAWHEEAKVLREEIVKQVDPGFRSEMAAAANASRVALEQAVTSGRAFEEVAKKTAADIDRISRESAARLTRATEILADRITTIANRMQSSAARLEETPSRTSAGPSAAAIRTLRQKIGDVLRHPLHFGFRRKKKRSS